VKWSNAYRMRLMLCGVVTVVMLSVVNARGAYFLDDFDRSDGEVGNGWETWTDEDIEIKIVDNEVLIAGQQNHDWWRSGIYRFVEDETRFAFDFKADDRFNVHIRFWGGEKPDDVIGFYAWPGGPFSYRYNVSGVRSGGWIKIDGSEMITGQYNNLVVEREGTEFTLTLNGQVVGTVTINNFLSIGEMDICADASAGTVGSLHIDNVVIGQPPIITNFDFNGDGTVDVNDVVTLTDYWGQDYSVCDISPMPSGDGIVDAKDLLALANYLEQETALIAHWPLDETEGVANDLVGNNLGYVLGGGVWEPDGGQIGGAIRLDGVDGCVAASLVPNPAEGPFGVFAWVLGGAPGQVIVSATAGANWLMLDAEGRLMTEVKSPDPAGTPLLSQAVVSDGNWHRVGLVWDGSNRMLYVDDAVVAEDTQDSLEGSLSGLYIGCGKNMQPGTFFSGLIDDVRIYNRGITQ